MKERLIALKEFRDRAEQISGQLSKARDQFEKDNYILIEKVKSLSNIIIGVEGDIREEALTKFAVTGEKKLEYGVGIRIMKKVNYDPIDAFNWAKDHQLALSLDKKAFEKIANAQPIDFVKIEEQATATIPKELKLEEMAR